MFAIADVEKSSIRRHYDLSTVFYWLFWGSHIHHGLWSGNETAPEAQRNLTDTLAAHAGLRADERVLDVGCGMGGSAIHLAQRPRCRVTGITLSPVQRRWASVAARWWRVADRTEFHCQDVERASFDPGSFDVIWSIECTEHLFDKAAFFRRVFPWLRPGGRLAVCAWCARDGDLTVQDHRLLQGVCQGMLCPSLGSFDDYAQWIEASGMRVVRCEDWTNRVRRTWEICRARVEVVRLRSLVRWIDRDSVSFLDRFQTMLDAYSTGAMRYGCFIAHRPH